MGSFAILSAFAVLLCDIVLGANFPIDLQRCQFEDENCLNDVITGVIAKHHEGYRPLHLIGIDPLKIKSMIIAQNPQSPVGITLKFTDFLLIGFKNTKVYRSMGFKKDLNKPNFEVDVKIPSLQIVGPYEIKGNVLILPISGHGQSNLTLENVDAKIKATGRAEVRNGEEYLKLTKIKLHIDISRLRVNFENLFNGDKTLADNMNLFINENWEEIFAELRPSIADAISEILQIAIQGPFDKIPYKYLFLE